MEEADQEKTAFITDRGLYCYKMMPFGLKNAGATYQRLVNRMFRSQIGRNVEVYVDDMQVKSIQAAKHIEDLRETFQTLRKYKVKLNPMKCAFRVSSGKFLEFMVSQRGIKANPEKVKAVLEMEEPRTTKQLQRLTGRITALNQFMSRSTDKCLPFFKILRKAFTWSEELSLSAVSSTLVRENAGIQKLVYFTSKALHGAEERYLRIEKLVFALIVLARRLRPYFQAHAIRVLTEYPMKKTTIKGQVLADFLVEFCNIPEAEELPKELTWVVYVDGSSARGRSGVGVLLRNLEGQEFGFAIKLDFVTTNNEAKYEAVIAGLALSREMGAINVEIRSDSQVVVGQVQGQFETQEDRMAIYLDQVRQFQSYFERVVITKIPQEENIRADEFSKFASGTNEEIEASRRQIIVLTEPSITSKTNVMEADTTPNEPKWATEIIQFLRNGLLPEDKVEARKVKIQATRFCLLEEVLYKRGYSEPLLKCLFKTEVDYVLKEIHEGVCRNNSGGRMLAQKTIRAGYYWPTISKDSALLVKHCDKCQRFSRLMKTAPEKFTKWAEAEAQCLFLWKSVVCQLEIPHAFVTDNGKQFDCEPFRRWCLELLIRNYYVSVLYPKANGQVEATNKTLVRTLKKKLEKKKGPWVEYIPEVLWSYRTTRRTPTGETPFSLTFGTEAVIPAEVGSPNFRLAYYNPGLNDEKAKLHLDLLQEKRDDSQVTWAAYQNRTTRYFNKLVVPKNF
ncbi:uncharacterized protein LOC133873301 [Alnus glutinosa]|uniref:uncharacterized protein LOC133873301 n=1 Tax=Alnus glutinosa TaxID=3517 RepID=UPI002D78BDFB|nr:uncharacterized protein LOC133873301 [Alnus glutinosa]